MTEKIVVVIMGQNCEKFIGMALESIKNADAIVYCDGGSTDDIYRIIGCHNENSFQPECEVIENKYDQEDKGMNGKQRNFYLDHVKKEYPGWWCLVIDADEVVEDFSKIRYFIDNLPKDQHDVLWSIKMRHFIGNLGHEDATLPIHFVQHRLFKIRDELEYPEVEHPVLGVRGKGMREANIQPTTIWHLAYIPNLWDYKKKYENHMKKSDIHRPEFLRWWYLSHLFGRFPHVPINLTDVPEIILNEFGIPYDELYFANRKELEVKHFGMMKSWIRNWPVVSILDVGCGWGHFGFVATEFFNKEYLGIDKSKWAIENMPYKQLDLRVGDITKELVLPRSDYDLVMCIDILEHLEEKDLDFALSNISKVGKHFIFSIPYLGTPELEGDATHKIKEDKDWWIKKLSEYFKIKDAPTDWLYHQQILVGEKK